MTYRKAKGEMTKVSVYDDRDDDEFQFEKLKSKPKEGNQRVQTKRDEVRQKRHERAKEREDSGGELVAVVLKKEGDGKRQR